MYLYQDGEWVERDKYDGLLRGEAIFETVRTWNGNIFALTMHYERLMESAHEVSISLPFNVDELRGILKEGIGKVPKSRNEEIRFRIILTLDANPSVYIWAEPFSIPDYIHEEGVKVGISRYRRMPVESCPPKVKFLSRPDIILARKHKGDNYDVIMLNIHGCVAEGTFSNVFLVKSGALITPDVDSGILPGITRKIVMDFARELEIPVFERKVEVRELFQCDEMFLTHTSAGIVPVRRLETRTLIEDSVGGITKILMDVMRKEIFSKDEYWE